MTSSAPAKPVDTPADGPSMRDKVRSAVLWRSGALVAAQLVTWTSTFFVIRILDPEDYGLYAITGVILTLLSLVDGTALANAAIQRRTMRRALMRQLFGLLIALNAMLALIQFIAAPWIANFYGHPILADMLRWQCLMYAANPPISLAYTVLSRRMDFRMLAQSTLASSVLGAMAALACALAGFGIWALVIAPIVTFCSRAVIMMVLVRAFMWPSFRFGRSAWALVRFASTMLVGAFAWFFTSQADVLIGGRLLEPAELGLYTTALFLVQIIPGKFVPPLNEIAFSAYSRMQDDRAALRFSYLKATRIIVLATVPLCFGMSAVAEPMVHVLLDTKWLAAAPLIAMLGFAMPFIALEAMFTPAANAIGKPIIATIITIIAAVLFTVAFIIGVQWGTRGLAIAWLCVAPIYLAIAARMILPRLGLPWLDYVEALAPPLVAGILMYLSVVAAAPYAAPLAPIPELALLVAVGGIAYGGALLVIGRDRIVELIDLLRRR